MLLGSCPRLLVLALSLPEVSYALGLGTLHVQSSLNEPLSAQIEIIGATPDELQAIRASVASPELFQRFNADRPAFLSSAMILVGTDAAGKPVLNIQSSDAFTEPLVELLIDLRSGHEQMVRDYTLMLDPARTTPIISASSISASSTAVPNEASTLLVELPPVTVPKIVLASASVTTDPEMLYRIVAHDTLRGIALHAGARSEAELQRMMRAIYRGNRKAFAGNINRLHTGAMIRIPAVAENPAWRRTGRPAPQRAATAPAIAQSEPVATRLLTSQGADLSAVLSAMNSLHGQVQFLQQTLGETSQQLANANARLGELERGGMPHTVVASRATTAQDKPHSSDFSARGILAGLALLMGALAFAWRRLQSRRAPAREPVSAAEPTVEAPLLDTATVEMARVVDIEVDTVEMRSPTDDDEADTVAAEILGPQAGDATGTALDYNLSDLDGHAHHVEMPDTLRDPAAVVERRKNVVDTLMAALQRDPKRSDLRMKLLETLYTAAATNLRIFKDVMRDVVRHPERLNADEWEQVLAMGRQIAADDPLFADQASGENIADCA